MNLSDVVVMTVNFRTEGLLRRCVGHFRALYPDMLHVVIDNASRDGSTDYVQQLGERENTIAILNGENLGQGEALNRAIADVDFPYVFTLCSDCRIQRGGLIEAMRARFDQVPELFAIGNRVLLRKGGDLRYVHLFAALLDRAKFLALAPFDDYPKLPIALDTMVDAQRKGYALEHFPVFDYVEHDQAGTWREAARQVAEGEIDLEEVANWPPWLRQSRKLRGVIKARQEASG